MIQAILSFQFVLNQKETGEIEPEFKPIKLIFKSLDGQNYTKENYSDLINQNDIFAIFYQHTTGIYGVSGAYGNFYIGRLKKTPYQVVSYFRQEEDRSQFLTISIFDLDDEVEIYEDLIKSMAKKLDVLFETLVKANQSRKVSLITNVLNRIEDELRLTIFQVERLSNLDKLQKAALIFNSPERMEILNTLRKAPISKREMKNKLERIKPNANVDILIEPFLELNLIRRDWIKGERDKRTGKMLNQGEYLFLTKDIILAKVPHDKLLEHLKEKDPKSALYLNYYQQVIDYFSYYDPLKQTDEDLKKIASVLLNPDMYDFFNLLKGNYYPLDKIPKILSEWADHEEIVDTLTELKIATIVKDEKDRKWIMLLCDIKPLIIFPEYLLPLIREAYQKKELTKEIAKKAYDLLEVSYPEKVEF
ncbi:MAG: hypothetical protein ACTSQP_19380 [Promethearchaeota archaeon]